MYGLLHCLVLPLSDSSLVGAGFRPAPGCMRSGHWMVVYRTPPVCANPILEQHRRVMISMILLLGGRWCHGYSSSSTASHTHMSCIHSNPPQRRRASPTFFFSVVAADVVIDAAHALFTAMIGQLWGGFYLRVAKTLPPLMITIPLRRRPLLARPSTASPDPDRRRTTRRPTIARPL